MSLVETFSEVHHSHDHSWCYLLDCFPIRRLQLNQITWMIFVYYSFQVAPKEEIARHKIGWPRGPSIIAEVRDNVPWKELPPVTNCSLCGVRNGHILLEPNVIYISSKLVQLWLQEILQHFNVTSRCNGYCTAVLVFEKVRPQNTKFSYSTPKRKSLTVKRSLVKFMRISSCPIVSF